jgi:putative hydrolase of HD superfamily
VYTDARLHRYPEQVTQNQPHRTDEIGAAAAAIVGRQLDAYNARDLDAFMACWADDATMLAWPDTLLEEGWAAIRARHATRFEEPDLHARLISRTSLGGLVIDREEVTRNLPQGLAELDVIGIYEVREGLIRRAWFQQGEPRPRVGLA